MEMYEEKNRGIEGKVVAVTGGLGLVGSNICLELLRRGALQVRSLDCRTTSPWSDRLKESGVQCINGIHLDLTLYSNQRAQDLRL